MSTRALAILAGGRGERLGGVIKPLLVRPDGKTLLEHLRATLEPLVDETLIVAPRAIAHHFAGTVVEDPGQGPGLALASVANATACDLILLAAGDLVSPSAELTELLLSRAGGGAAAPSIDGVVQPAFAAYDAGAVRAIDPPLPSLQGYCARLQAIIVDLAHGAAVEDVDTAEDVVRHGLSTEHVPRWT